jgi:hypothetical protein
MPDDTGKKNVLECKQVKEVALVESTNWEKGKHRCVDMGIFEIEMESVRSIKYQQAKSRPHTVSPASLVLDAQRKVLDLVVPCRLILATKKEINDKRDSRYTYMEEESNNYP